MLGLVQIAAAVVPSPPSRPLVAVSRGRSRAGSGSDGEENDCERGREKPENRERACRAGNKSRSEGLCKHAAKHVRGATERIKIPA
jgi:hypothetical protein